MSDTAPRIGKIVLRDFRFFPGNETYTFDLAISAMTARICSCSGRTAVVSHHYSTPCACS
jgi:hypothetical protein